LFRQLWDTTPEAFQRMQAIWLAKTGEERLEWWSRQMHAANMTRWNLIRDRNPGASEAEVDALWVEETYQDRHDIDPEFLARACDHIRARGAIE
jgi:hypothetical protein